MDSSHEELLDEVLDYAIRINDIKMVNEILETGVNLELRNEMGYNALHVAAEYGNHAAVKLILSKGVDIDSLGSEDKRSALHLAMFSRSLEIAEILIKNNANINIQDVYGNTVLHLAESCESTQLVKTLLKRGADPNIMNESKESPFLLLSYSDLFVYTGYEYHELKDLFNIFLNYGLNVNQKDEFGQNVLHLAAQMATATVVRRILKMNVNVNERCDHGYVPMHEAARNKNGTEGRRIIKMLIKHGADINVRDESNRTPFIISITEGRHEVAEYLINQRNFDRETYGYDPLYLAIQAKSSCTIYLLAKHGYRPMDSAKCGLLAAKIGHVDTMEALLRSGMEIDAADSKQGLSILTACLYSDHDNNWCLVDLLLRRGADINYEQKGWLPLSKVWEDPLGSLIVSQTLLKHVALLVARNKYVHHLHLKMIKANVNLKRKFGLYTLELSRMKNTYVWEGVSPVTYFDLLVLRNDALMKYLRCQEIRATFESGRYKNICNEYRAELEGNVDEGIHRLKAVRMWEDTLHEIFQDLLPFEITCRIATYMLHFFRYSRYIHYNTMPGTHTYISYGKNMGSSTRYQRHDM